MTSTLLLWIIAVGAGTGGVTGIGALDELNAMNSSLEEQVRQAEQRGQIQSDIRAIRKILDRHESLIATMMPNAGVIKLHDQQQNLIDRLIDFTAETVTKTELNLAVKKIQAQMGEKK